MDERQRQEYKALRATIRERGTVRAITFLATMIGWGTTFLMSIRSEPIALLAPLLVLVAGFEVIFQLHVGVERVGRYLQAAFEERREPSGDAASQSSIPPAGWETMAMAYGKAFPGAGSDPLFAWVFALALLVNLVPALVAVLSFASPPGRLLVPEAVILAHSAFAIRIGRARQRSMRQRAEDLERFRRLLGEASPLDGAKG